MKNILIIIALMLATACSPDNGFVSPQLTHEHSLVNGHWSGVQVLTDSTSYPVDVVITDTDITIDAVGKLEIYHNYEMKIHNDLCYMKVSDDYSIDILLASPDALYLRDTSSPHSVELLLDSKH